MRGSPTSWPRRPRPRPGRAGRPRRARRPRPARRRRRGQPLVPYGAYSLGLRIVGQPAASALATLCAAIGAGRVPRHQAQAAGPQGSRSHLDGPAVLALERCWLSRPSRSCAAASRNEPADDHARAVWSAGSARRWRPTPARTISAATRLDRASATASRTSARSAGRHRGPAAGLVRRRRGGDGASIRSAACRQRVAAPPRSPGPPGRSRAVRAGRPDRRRPGRRDRAGRGCGHLATAREQVVGRGRVVDRSGRLEPAALRRERHDQAHRQVAQRAADAAVHGGAGGAGRLERADARRRSTPRRSSPWPSATAGTTSCLAAIGGSEVSSSSWRRSQRYAVSRRSVMSPMITWCIGLSAIGLPVSANFLLVSLVERVVVDALRARRRRRR